MAPTTTRPVPATPTTPPTSSSSASSRSRSATAFRITLNTLENPSLIAFSIAIGGVPGKSYPFPDGANVSAPASLFLTVHPSGSTLVGSARSTLRRGAGWRTRSTVRVDLARRQIEVDVPHSDWNPARRRSGFAMGVGLWDAATNATCSRRRPRAPRSPAAPARRRIRRRSSTSRSGPTPGAAAVPDRRLGRDRSTRAGGATRPRGRRSPPGTSPSSTPTSASPSCCAGCTDNSQIPTTGPIDRILASHFEPAQGANFSSECGLQGSSNPASCKPEYHGQLEPYAIYVPSRPSPGGRLGDDAAAALAVGQLQPVHGHPQPVPVRQPAGPSIVITPEARGPDQFYQGLGGADVFEVWAAVARLYQPESRVHGRSPATRWAAWAPSSSEPSSRICSPAPSRPSGTSPTPTCSPRCATCRC